MRCALVCLALLACERPKLAPAPRATGPVGAWEFIEDGDRIRLELDASGAARLQVGDEEVLGTTGAVETHYYVNSFEHPTSLLLVSTRGSEEWLKLAMRIQVHGDRMRVRTFFNEELPPDFGSPGDDMTRVFERVQR